MEGRKHTEDKKSSVRGPTSRRGARETDISTYNTSTYEKELFMEIRANEMRIMHFEDMKRKNYYASLL